MIRIVFTLLFVALLSGCSSLSYYSQAVGGHLEVMAAARPIDALIEDPATDDKLREQLKQVKTIREFAVGELGLPDNGSYREYVDLGRPFVVWNVSATPELSLRPQQWCMFVVGCVSYRGFYERKDAEQLAAELRRAGYETYVGGVPAYSTLGFFSDPVLNTFLRYGELEVARLIFHELAHQLAFAEGDSAFNESFATAVEREGVRRWLARSASKEQREAYALDQQRRDQFSRLTSAYRERLARLYDSDLPVDAKRSEKLRLFAKMRQDYADMKVGWGGSADYDGWFERDFNNAKMAAQGVYNVLVPALEKLLAAEQGDLKRFYRRAAELAKLSHPERMAALEGLTPAVEPVKHAAASQE